MFATGSDHTDGSYYVSTKLEPAKTLTPSGFGFTPPYGFETKISDAGNLVVTAYVAMPDTWIPSGCFVSYIRHEDRFAQITGDAYTADSATCSAVGSITGTNGAGYILADMSHQDRADHADEVPQSKGVSFSYGGSGVWYTTFTLPGTTLRAQSDVSIYHSPGGLTAAGYSKVIFQDWSLWQQQS